MMNILKIDDGISEVGIGYSEKLADGIYKVVEASDVKQNCAMLKITIDEPRTNKESIEKVTKLGEVGILTIRVAENYLQFIFTNEVKPQDFEVLLATVPIPGRDAFRSAYNATKRITLDDYDSFAKLFSNIKQSN